VASRGLVFDSQFESGNLSHVARTSDFEYELLLEPDTNTAHKTQWFFFSVSNTAPVPSIRFNILNFEKDESLFAKRMRVLTFSRRTGVW
jgi:hypothetical protein